MLVMNYVVKRQANVLVERIKRCVNVFKFSCVYQNGFNYFKIG